MPCKLRHILPLTAALLASGTASAEPRIVTKSSQGAFTTSTQVIGKVPRGYRIAWKDGRLNPVRGPRSLQGNAQMRLVWTDTVPRRLRR